MHWKLVLFNIAVCLFSCSQASSNLQYHNNLKFKALFAYDGSLYGHILFVAKKESYDQPNQQELESLALFYASNFSNHSRNLDYIKFINNEHAQKSYYERDIIATVIFYNEGNKCTIKQFMLN